MFATDPLTKDKGEFLAKWYFRAGFLGLPWMWFANALMFYRYKHNSEVIAWYVKWSAILFVIATLLFIVWLAVIYTEGWGLPIWIIKPGVGGYQPGLFAQAVYSNSNF